MSMVVRGPGLGEGELTPQRVGSQMTVSMRLNDAGLSRILEIVGAGWSPVTCEDSHGLDGAAWSEP